MPRLTLLEAGGEEKTVNPQDIEFGLDSFVPLSVDESGQELAGDVVIRNTVEEAVKAMKDGAYDFLTKPFRREPADRRRHIVELSPRGGDELCLAYTRLRFVEDDLFSALSADERVTLYDLLVRAVGTRVPPCDVVEELPPCPA